MQCNEFKAQHNSKGKFPLEGSKELSVWIEQKL